MTRNNADHSATSSSPKLNTMGRLRALLRQTSMTIGNLAMAMEYSYGDYTHDRILELEKRVTGLEKQVSLINQNRISREDNS